MPEIVVVTDLDASVADVLAASLDLDVEVAAARRHRVRAVPDGEGSRVSGRIAEGERVRWRARLWGLVPVGHTSVIDEVVADDGRGARASPTRWRAAPSTRSGTSTGWNPCWTTVLG